MNDPNLAGYRGVATKLRIGGQTIIVIAESQTDLSTFYERHFPKLKKLDPIMCERAIMIAAKNLPA